MASTKSKSISGGRYAGVVVKPEHKEVSARVKLHHYRFPSSGHESGNFAIVFCTVLEVTEGEIPEDAMTGETICLYGSMPSLNEKGEYLFRGTLNVDPKWGYQYKVHFIGLSYDLTTEENQRKFFGFFLTERQIEMLFSAYPDPVSLLKNEDIASLVKIKGIGPITATRLCQRYKDNITNGYAYVELEGLGLTKQAIDKLVRDLGSPEIVVERVKKNPYDLITLAHGYGWVKADAIAEHLGFTSDCPERVVAFVRYFLLQKATNGHSRCPIEELITAALQTCYPLTRERFWELIDPITATDDTLKGWLKKADDPALRASGELPRFFYSKTVEAIGSFTYRKIEDDIANELQRLKRAKPIEMPSEEECNAIIEATQKSMGFVYTHEQRRAMKMALERNIIVITGNAGTGKSSILAPLVKIFESADLRVAQCALSGRAASLLTEYTGLTGKTIHRLLSYTPELGRFKFDKFNKLLYDVVILDETSMVGEDLFLALISAIKSGAKLIMLGDIQQLPPISVGNILHDCVASGYIPTNTLTVIQRQAQASGIISQAAKVCQGKALCRNDFIGTEIRGELRDFKIVGHSDAALVHAEAIAEFKHLWGDLHIPVDDIQLVVPIRMKGINSCRMFNAEIQMIVNSDEKKKSIPLEYKGPDGQYEVVYRVDDRVMIIHNNYALKTIYGEKSPVYNGNMGHIVDIDGSGMIIRMDAVGDEEERLIILPRSDWGDVVHAWCSTCHKLQGSQAKYVIIALDSSAFPLLMREWLYTAITRARKYCALIGQPKAINMAVRNSDIKTKQTWLTEQLQDIFLNDEGVTR